MNAYTIPGIAVTTKMIEEAACNTFGIAREDLYRKTRQQDIVWARHCVFYFRHEILKEEPQRKITEGTGFDRTTMLHSVGKVKTFNETNDKEFMPAFYEFMGRLGRKYENN